MHKFFNRLRTLAFFVVCLSTLSMIEPALAGIADGKLDIYWVDVEGGAATLVVTPAGESLLIDSGNPGRRDAGRIFDVAAKVAMLRQIDHLLVTHYHIDHFGGAATLATLMPIKHVYDNGEFAGGIERPDREYLDFMADQRSVLNPGDELQLKSRDAVDNAPSGKPLEVRVRCLAARQRFVSAHSGSNVSEEPCSSPRLKDRDESDNANSIVTLLWFGPFKFFDAGDLTWNMEHKLVCPHNLVGQVDVYQVTHHGLDVSNNPLVIKALAPTVAVMNNGANKGCEPETFAALKGAASIQAVYQMHKNLQVDDAHNAPADRIANMEKSCAGNYIHLAVEPDGRAYTIEIPANKHSRRFTTK